MRRLGSPLLALLVAAASLAPPAGRARADEPAAGASAGFDAAVALYEDLEYERATVALEEVLAGGGLSREQQLAGYRYLALAYLAIGRDAEAVGAFERLLAVDPAYVLPATDSGRAQEAFAAARARRPAAVSLSAGFSPATPRAGDAVSVEIAVDDPGGRVTRVTVSYRARGGKGWSEVQAKAVAMTPGAWSAVIPGMFVSAPGLEYFVAARDAAGAVVAESGSAAGPLVLAVTRPADKVAAPFYTRWWFWTGAGAVVAGGVAAILLLSGDGDGAGDDASVTITVP